MSNKTRDDSAMNREEFLALSRQEMLESVTAEIFTLTETEFDALLKGVAAIRAARGVIIYESMSISEKFNLLSEEA